MAASKYTANMFDAEELAALREKFNYVDTDIKGRHRLFMDNAGGSLRLKAAENEFKRVSEMPDASEHSNELALELLALEDKARIDIKSVIFGAKTGVIYPSYTASQIMMDVARIFADHAKGTNYVTTVLEHPSSFDAMTYNASKHGCELRVAQANPATGGVDAEAVLDLIDENTAVLSCMAASNISGYIYDLKTICKKAREKNPDIFIICDAVQHAPHGTLNPEELGVDMMHFAPTSSSAYAALRWHGCLTVWPSLTTTVCWARPRTTGRSAARLPHSLLPCNRSSSTSLLWAR